MRKIFCKSACRANNVFCNVRDKADKPATESDNEKDLVSQLVHTARLCSSRRSLTWINKKTKYHF